MRVRVGSINSFDLIWSPQIIEANLVEMAILGGLNNLCIYLQRNCQLLKIEKSGPFLPRKMTDTPFSREEGPHHGGHHRIGRGGGGRCPHWYHCPGGNPSKGQTL